MTAWRGIFRKVLGAGLPAALCMVGQASAGNVSAPGSVMVTGGLTSQPIGHYEFCQANPRECAMRPSAARAHMTQSLWTLLQTVNLGVNDTVKPVSDIDLYGRDEVWAYPDGGFGDCEDYVLEKRRALERDGVSLANLLITVVRKPDSEGHAVLTVLTDQGDFILDNLSERVTLWSETRYRYLKRQATNDTGRWVSLREDNNPLVAAVRK